MVLAQAQQLEAGEQLASDVPNRSVTGTVWPKAHQRGMDAALQGAPVVDQVGRKRARSRSARTLVWAARSRHEVATGQLSQHVSVDLVGLGGQGARPFAFTGSAMATSQPQRSS